jgi:hypothetical protein
MHPGMFIRLAPEPYTMGCPRDIIHDKSPSVELYPTQGAMGMYKTIDRLIAINLALNHRLWKAMNHGLQFVRLSRRYLMTY